jgi:AraC-like DNA-binding protein
VAEHESPRISYEDVRVGPLMPIPPLLAEFGLDPARVIGDTGLDVRAFDDPENCLSFDALGRLLETCVDVTGCAHFGLLIGKRFELGALGVLGALMSNCPTLREALRMATRHLDLHDRGAVSLALDLGHSRSALGYSLIGGKTPASAQILDGALAMQVRLLRTLCGPSFKPLLVQLAHKRPAALAPFREHFGPNLEFDARLSAIVFASRWLDHPIAGADPAAYAAIVAAIGAHESRDARAFSGEVRRAVYAMIFADSASAASLARLFGMHERTLRRRLAQEGVTVRGLVSGVRRELAHQLLRDTALPVSEIAAILGYSGLPVFGRAFRSWSAMNPRAWRAAFAAPAKRGAA